MRISRFRLVLAFFVLPSLLPVISAQQVSPPSVQTEQEKIDGAVKETPATMPPKEIGLKEPVELGGLSDAVARAAVWDNYWFGFWKSIPRMAEAQEQLTGWPVRATNGEDVLVFVDELHSVFSCSFQKQYACDFVWNYGDRLCAEEPDFVEYESIKKSKGAGQQKISIVMRPELLRAVNFSSFDDAKARKVQILINAHYLDKEFFHDARKYYGQRARYDPIRIRVGNFNLDSPLIYFYVDGMPYLPIMSLDPTASRFVYLDEWSIDSGSHRCYYPHAIKRIRENGAWFTVENGKLVREKSEGTKLAP